MKIDLQDVTDTRKTLAVTLDADEVAAEEKSLLSQFKGMAKIPGFRPGKAPESVVRKRFSKEIAGELKQHSHVGSSTALLRTTPRSDKKVPYWVLTL